jgi:hypothetical protein
MTPEQIQQYLAALRRLAGKDLISLHCKWEKPCRCHVHSTGSSK